ncbi:MAG: ribonuclease H-like domain-containing protein [Desulfohalobiaceae bacterium]
MEIYIDIETLPGPERPSPEDIEPPKNYKDPAKIKAYQQEKLEEIYRAQALDSMQGRILCIGWAIGDDPVSTLCVGLDGIHSECDLLHNFQDTLLDYFIDLEGLKWTGHNVRAFDLAWLWRKALQHRLFSLARIIPRARYDKRIMDTLEIWAADYRDKVSLEAIAHFLGLTGKTEGLDGTKVYDFWLEGRLQEIRDYCAWDVELTRQVYRIVTGASIMDEVVQA